MYSADLDVYKRQHRVIAQNLDDAFTQSGRGLGISYNQNKFYFRIDNILILSLIHIKMCIRDSVSIVSNQRRAIILTRLLHNSGKVCNQDVYKRQTMPSAASSACRTMQNTRRSYLITSRKYI